MSSFGGSVKLTGESEYRKALSEISSNLKVLNSEMKSVTSQYDKNDKSVENLSSQNEVLNKKIDEQEKKVSILKDALAKSKEETGENSEKTKKWQTELNNAQADLNKLNRELDTNKKTMAEAVDGTKKEADAVVQSLPPVSVHVAVIVLEPGLDDALIQEVSPPVTVHLGAILSIFIVFAVEYAEQFPALSHALYLIVDIPSASTLLVLCALFVSFVVVPVVVNWYSLNPDVASLDEPLATV